MDLTLALNKTVEQNAEECFQKAKKFKKKLEGVRTTIEKFKEELQNLELNKEKFEKEFEEKEQKREEKTQIAPEPKKWYHSFRWFISSEGYLCVGGRDADTNEIMIKRYTEKEDLVFHTELPGSPFFVIKTKGEKLGDKLTEKTLNEVAVATASYSKAWKQGITVADVYWINSEQVKKEIGLPKGSFMIHGKRNYFRVALKIAIGILETGEVMGGPIEAVKAQCKKYFIVEQGKDKPSDAGKKIQKHLGGNLDDIIRVIPAGECKVTLVESK
jgi:predicted ribosome quality control (RQC) complex YloA/Tae2 family protein